MGTMRGAVRISLAAVLVLASVGACRPAADQGGGSGGGTAAGPTAAPTSDRPTKPTTKPKPPRQTGEPTRSPTTRPPSSSTPPGCPQGERQREVERYLAELGGFGRVSVDGRQSAADCAAIKRFQRRYDIRPAEGRAGPVTADVARRLASTDTSRCRAGSGTTFCVDLTLQTVWVMRSGRVVLGPTVTRTGMPGYRTPTGTFEINYRNVKEWSDPYEVWLPYWQHFIQGIGFHQTTTYLHEKSIGSHGCINLLPADAREMWELGRVGTRVYVFGRRPGT